MNCNQINELLMDYLYQELDPGQVERFEAHLQHCASCSEELSAFEQTRGLFRELPEEDPPPALSLKLLAAAQEAVEPPAPGFWERLRLSLRAMTMHPAMTAAVTLVLVLGVSFYVYRQGPGPSSRAPMGDMPLLEDDSLAREGTATIGVANEQAEGEAPMAQQVAGAAGQEALQAPEPKGGNPALEERQGWADGKGRGGPARKVASRKAKKRKKTVDSLGDLQDVYKSLAGRRDEDSAPAAASAPQPAPAAPPPPRTRSQLAKRSGKSALSVKELAPRRRPSANRAARASKGSGSKQGASVDNSNSLAGMDDEAPPVQVAGEAQGTASKASGGTRPAPKARPGASQWQRMNFAPAADSVAEVVKRPVSVSQKRMQTQAPLTQVSNKDEAKAADKSRTTAKSKPTPSKARGKAGTQVADYVRAGDNAARAGRCLDAFYNYSMALAKRPDMRSVLTPRLNSCINRSSDKELAQAQKKYPNLSSILAKGAKAKRSRAAESKKKAPRRKKGRKMPKSKAVDQAAY